MKQYCKQLSYSPSGLGRAKNNVNSGMETLHRGHAEAGMLSLASPLHQERWWGWMEGNGTK